MILIPKRKIQAGLRGAGSAEMNYLINHISQSTIREIESALFLTVDRLHVQSRLRIPVGTDKFDIG